MSSQADFKVIAAKSALKKARDYRAKGDASHANQNYRLAIHNYQELATLFPEQADDYLSIVELIQQEIDDEEMLVAQAKKSSSSTASDSKKEENHPQERRIEEDEEESSTRKDIELPDEVKALFKIVDPSDIKTSFDSVIGLEDAKELVKELIIEPFLYPDKFNYNFEQNYAILLEGPPGTGKTTFVRAIAKEIGLPFAFVSMSGLISSYVGETARNIDKMFQAIKTVSDAYESPVVVYCDEFDSIARSRLDDDKGSRDAVPALLRNMDGFERANFFILFANTNHKEVLDKAIISRFIRCIKIDLPTPEMREQLFHIKLNEIEPEFLNELNFKKFVELSDGFSGRDIANVCDSFKRKLARIKAGTIKKCDLTELMCSLITTRETENF